MPIDHNQLSSLSSLALYLCLQDLVDSIQQEIDMEATQPHTGTLPVQVNTELWQKKDVDSFVEAIHSILLKAPNGGFKATHFQEVLHIQITILRSPSPSVYLTPKHLQPSQSAG